MGADLPRTIPANPPNHQRTRIGDLLEQFLEPTRNPNIAAETSARPCLPKHRRGLESEPTLTRQPKRLKCVNAVETDGAEQIGALIALVGGLTRSRSSPRPLPHDAVFSGRCGPHLGTRSRSAFFRASPADARSRRRRSSL
jgi:hypothetical protein